MTKQKFKQSEHDWCMYTKDLMNGKLIYLLLYVDDMLLAGPNDRIIQVVKNLLKSEFEMKDLGPAKKILGIEIVRNRSRCEMKLLQSSYIQKVISRFSMEGAKPASVPLGGHFKLSSD